MVNSGHWLRQSAIFPTTGGLLDELQKEAQQRAAEARALGATQMHQKANTSMRALKIKPDATQSCLILLGL